MFHFIRSILRGVGRSGDDPSGYKCIEVNNKTPDDWRSSILRHAEKSEADERDESEAGGEDEALRAVRTVRVVFLSIRRRYGV